MVLVINGGKVPDRPLAHRHHCPLPPTLSLTARPNTTSLPHPPPSIDDDRRDHDQYNPPPPPPIKILSNPPTHTLMGADLPAAHNSTGAPFADPRPVRHHTRLNQSGPPGSSHTGRRKPVPGVRHGLPTPAAPLTSTLRSTSHLSHHSCPTGLPSRVDLPFPLYPSLELPATSHTDSFWHPSTFLIYVKAC